MNTGPAIIAGRYAVLQGTDPRRGGMSTVYACTDLAAEGRRVAVKVISPPREYDYLESLIYERELNVKDVVHPNIVQLFDVGRNGEDGKYFLVYEWIPRNLRDWLQENPEVGADDFVEAIALPLLRALAYAHERQVVHRDVKPSNVLVDDKGVPKLADFGISKVKYKLAEDAGTLYEFSSKPFAPPEGESQSGYTRDVFGFGVLLLSCLSAASVKDYGDFDDALDSLDVPPSLADLIGQCVSLDERDRPRNAVELLAKLEDLQRVRRQKWAKPEVLYLSLSRAATRNLAETAVVGEAVVPDLVEKELSDAPAVRLLEADPEKPLPTGERHAFIYGNSWSFRVGLTIGHPIVEIIGARRVGEAECDDRRDRHFTAGSWRFACSLPLDQNAAQDSIEKLIDAVELFDLERAAFRLEREDQRLFDQWRRQLDAREAADLSREDRLRYSHVSMDGQRATFRLEKASESIEIEQRRNVLTAQGRRIASGEIERITDGELQLYLDHEPASRLPRTGILAIDSNASREKLRRERKALNAVRFSNADLKRTDLPPLLIHPEDSSPAVASRTEIDWIKTNLDSSKRQAVEAALAAQDFFAVQGPPGTGKTTFIAELVGQEFRRNPGVRILLASQTHVALDNALVRIRELELDARLLRLGNPAYGKIAGDVADLALENQLDAWRKAVRERSERFLETLATDRGGDLSRVRLSLQLSELSSLIRERMAVKEKIEAQELRLIGGVDSGAGPSMTVEEREDIEADLVSLRSRRAQLDRDARRIREQKTVSRELAGSQQNDPEAIRRVAEAVLSRATGGGDLVPLVDLQGKWVERLGRGPEFQAALLAATQVVAGTCVGLARASGIDAVPFDLCIVDEASKATATETLIPLIHAKRWVLVGDERQLPPFQDEALHDPVVVDDFGLDPIELERTLFSRLVSGLPQANSTALTTQYRMLPAIGNLISETFYGGKLDSHAQESPWQSSYQPRPVTWFSTETLDDRHERGGGEQGRSYLNEAEAREIARYLEDVNRSLTREGSGRKMHVLVLTPYRRQVAALTRRLSEVRQRCSELIIEVNTVDAVQGREADAVVFSTVRSNEKNRIGFVRDIARANVALSRGRFSLAIFGDAGFFDRFPSPLRDVLAYIRTHPRDCSYVVVAG